MAKSSKSKTAGRPWIQGLDEQQVREALEEAIVDANGEEEQHTGWLTAIGDELAFPFRGKVLGEVVNVVDMEWPEGDEFGLDLDCEWNRERHRFKARPVELLVPLSVGHLSLAAYLD